MLSFASYCVPITFSTVECYVNVGRAFFLHGCMCSCVRHWQANTTYATRFYSDDMFHKIFNGLYMLLVFGFGMHANVCLFASVLRLVVCFCSLSCFSRVCCVLCCVFSGVLICVVRVVMPIILFVAGCFLFFASIDVCVANTTIGGSFAQGGPESENARGFAASAACIRFLLGQFFMFLLSCLLVCFMVICLCCTISLSFAVFCSIAARFVGGAWLRVAYHIERCKQIGIFLGYANCVLLFFVSCLLLLSLLLFVFVP